MPPWNGARTKVQIKLSIQRLRSLQEKKLAVAKKSRREIADLLQKGRAETCRLRVEGLIQDDIYVELLEVLERLDCRTYITACHVEVLSLTDKLYVETLQARFGLLDTTSGEIPEPSIADAVCAIIYAAPRTELKELQILRDMLMHKYGRQLSLSLQPSDPPPSQVPTRVLSKLVVFVPSKDLVDAYLGEIARGYGIDWLPEPSFSKDEVVDDVDGGGKEGEDGHQDGGSGTDGKGDEDAGAGTGTGSGGSGGAAEKASSTPATESAPKRSTNPPPAGPEKEAWATGGATEGKKLTEDEELAARFERLQRLR